MPPCVHSVNAICATSLSFTQWTPRRGSPSTSNGQIGVATRSTFRSAESGLREEAQFAAAAKSQAALAIPLRLKQPSLSRIALVGERRQHGRNPLRLALSRSLALASAGSPRSGVRLVAGNDCSAGRSRRGPTEPLLPQPDAEDVDAHQGGARHVRSARGARGGAVAYRACERTTDIAVICTERPMRILAVIACEKTFKKADAGQRACDAGAPRFR